MKRIIITLIISVSIIAAVFAQDNIYVYRNDGEFKAFNKTEVDSITYSHIDNDGIYHTDWQAQLIHTADSTYRIPLTAIDSISFYTPPTVINEDVFLLTSSHDRYLTQADTVSFTFTKDTPAEMLPSKGNITVAEYDCTSFPDGIVARVETIIEDNNGFHFYCTKVGIDEVFDQILLFEKCSPITRQNAKSTIRPLAVDNLLWNQTHNVSLEKGNATVNMDVTDAAGIGIVIRKVKDLPFYFKMELENNLKTDITLAITSEANIHLDKQIGKTLNCGRIPIPGTPLFIVPKLNLSGYFNLNGNVSLESKAHFNRKDKIDIAYTDGQWNCNHTPSTDAGFDVTTLSMKGAAEIGVVPELLFSFCGTATGIGVNCSIGIKESVDFEFDALQYFNVGVYDAIKDSYARTTVPYSISAYAQAGLFDDKSSKRLSYTYSNEIKLGKDKFIVPEFSKPTCVDGTFAFSKTISSTVSRDLLLPVNLGFIIYNSKGQTVAKQYDHWEYKNADEWFPSKSYTLSFLGIFNNDEYTVSPLVKIMNKEIVATPSERFSCDTKSDSIPQELIGTWQCLDPEAYQYMEIKKDGTYSNYDTDGYGEEGTFLYYNNYMYMTQFVESEPRYFFITKIANLTETDLTLIYNDVSGGIITDSYGYSFKKLH